jgi:hypothetical protein
VVERGGLENRCTRERTVGSNPTPSATKSLISQNIRSGFEPSVRFAAFRGALREGVKFTNRRRPFYEASRSPAAGFLYRPVRWFGVAR